MSFYHFSGFHEEPPGGESLYRQALQTGNPVSGFKDTLPGGHAHPPGDASRIGSILRFSVFWSDFDRM